MLSTDPLDPQLRIDIFGGRHHPVLLAVGASLTSAVLLIVFGLGSFLVALGVLGFAGLALYVLARMEIALANRRSGEQVAARLRHPSASAVAPVRRDRDLGLAEAA